MFYLNLRHDISTRDFHELAPLHYPAYQRFFLACRRPRTRTSGDVARKNLSLYLNLGHDISTGDFHELAPSDYPAYQRFFLACRRPRTRAATSQEKTFRFSRGSLFRLDRNGKSRMKSLWHARYP